MILPEPQDLVRVPPHTVGVVGLDRHHGPHVRRPRRLRPGVRTHTDQTVCLRSIRKPPSRPSSRQAGGVRSRSSTTNPQPRRRTLATASETCARCAAAALRDPEGVVRPDHVGATAAQKVGVVPCFVRLTPPPGHQRSGGSRLAHILPTCRAPHSSYRAPRGAA
jgi:hypothetical protein